MGVHFIPASPHHHLRHQQRAELGQQLLVGIWVWNGTKPKPYDVAPCLFSVTLYVIITCEKPQVAGVIPMIQQTALKYDVEVKENGRVELSVPFPAGAHLIVFVIQADDAFDDLLMAAESSLDFWDNPWDDEDWNNA
jgi:hypothetical protein